MRVIMTSIFELIWPSDAVKWASSGSGNGLPPVGVKQPRKQLQCTWTNVHLLSIEPSATNLSEFWNELHGFVLKKMDFKVASALIFSHC